MTTVVTLAELQSDHHCKPLYFTLLSSPIKQTQPTLVNLLPSPIEDAQTAMSLVNLKLEKGLAYGDVVLGGQVTSLSMVT